MCPLASWAQAAKLCVVDSVVGICTRICASPVRYELQACTYACLVPVEMPAARLGAPRLLAVVLYVRGVRAGIYYWPCHGWVGARRALVDEKLAR